MIISSSLISLFIGWDALAFAASPDQSALAANDQNPALETVSDTAEPSLNTNEILAAIDAKMAETKTVRGGFVQVDAIGDTTTGDFYISRPGRVRFEYNPPAPYLIVSDGTTIAIEDKSLETIDRAPLSSTPLKHFLKRDLSLSSDAGVLDVRVLPTHYLVVMEDQPKEGEEAIEGFLFLNFDKTSFDLTGWVTLDGLNNETRVNLIDMEFNKNIPSKLFILEEEDDRDR